MIDLPEHAITEIVHCAKRLPEVEAVVVFGSRVLGNAKVGSDVDLAVRGENVTGRMIALIRDYLEEETTLPYFFDVIYFEGITNEALRKHIMEFGQVVYKK